MIINKKRYINRPSGSRQKFLIAEIRDKTFADLGVTIKQIRAIRMPDGYKTLWCRLDEWEVISESR